MADRQGSSRSPRARSPLKHSIPDGLLFKVWCEEQQRRWEEERLWREEDMAYREAQAERQAKEDRFEETEKIWREEDMEQRHVDNARYLWTRFVEKNRRDVEEKSEQLKAISNLAALFAGFAVVTLTQFDFDYEDNPVWIIAIYGILTAISVSLNTVAMVLATLILGSILKNGKGYVDEAAEEDFMFECRDFIQTYRPGDKPPSPRRTFQAFWEYRCEDDWKLAFSLFTWGVFSFLVSLVPIGWIKFFYSSLTAWSFTIVCLGSIIFWAYKQLYWGSYLVNAPEKEAAEEAEDEIYAPLVDDRSPTQHRP